MICESRGASWIGCGIGVARVTGHDSSDGRNRDAEMPQFAGGRHVVDFAAVKGAALAQAGGEQIG